MVARTAREILRWLESLYLTYPIVIPRWDLSNGYTYAEILHKYFPKDVNMFAFINGRSLNSRLLNWALIKQLVVKKKLAISLDFIDATLHNKDGGAESLLDQTYQLLTNKKPYIDPPYERSEDFSDHPYQQHLEYYERAHGSKAIKNNLKITELQTDPSYAYQAKRSQTILDRVHADRDALRIENPARFQAKPTLAERCLRHPLRSESNAQDWYTKTFDARSMASSTNKTLTAKQPSRHASADGSRKNSVPRIHSSKGNIEANEDNSIYKEIILRQHNVHLSDLLQSTES